MVIAARCPDASILEKFALGQMLPEEVEPLALHVEQCERCTQVLNGMKAEDTLIEAMSARSTAADEDNDKVDALIERLKALSAPDMAPRVEHTVTTVADDTPSSERRLDQGEDTPVPLSPCAGPG